MRQRTIGILGGALLAAGVLLNVGSSIALHLAAPNPRAAMQSGPHLVFPGSPHGDQRHPGPGHSRP